MASERESQHSLLSKDSLDTQPQRSWNPLSNRLTHSDYDYHPPSEVTWSEEVLRDVGLGISNSAGNAMPADDPIPADRRHSTDSTATTTPDSTYRIPQTPQTPHSPHSHAHVRCRNRATVLQKRLSWVPLTVLVLAIYATIFSGIYLVIALRKPRWHDISSKGPVAPSTATLLSAFFAKTIELAYVTICVAFLGQVLSRRALMRDSRGISISDMNMRAWIMQPGSMIVHWEALRYSALTFLGSVALVATFVAMLYTTAAQALVAPKLSLGPIEPTMLQGKVTASFANSNYIASVCDTPVTNDMDVLYRNTTCLQIVHAGHAYHNYQQWISRWSQLVGGSNETSSQLQKRPPPTGSLWDNTTVTGSWIDIQDMSTLSKKYKRMINNITMAMPHGGIPAAAMNTKNNLRQPSDTSGDGKYNIEASVPSPAINVLCAGMTEDDLKPLVYSSWPEGRKDFNMTTWNSATPGHMPHPPSWRNRTNVDELFEFSSEAGHIPPIFGKYPEPFNTILNGTGPWPTNALYLLGATPRSKDKEPDPNMPQYVMCALRTKQTGVCTTKYSADSSGASLSTDCENPSNKLQYDKLQDSFLEGYWNADWKNIASEWANSLSLNAGISDGAASNARLLMQMMPRYNKTEKTFALDPKLPSISEALAVMAGSTLILSSQDAPFVPFWNYTTTSLSEPVYQLFNASIQAVGYASGGTEKWQGVFYVILVFAFLTSAVCLGFMIVEARGRQVTDFTEPQNLFALAVNSPQTTQLEGACGCGPWGEQLKERWFIGMEEDDEHYYIRSKAEEKIPLLRKTVDSMPLEPMEIEDGGGGGRMLSPMVDEFRRVSKRHSFLAKLY
ncbi:uncharacterized protein N7479_009534 [Penicillium vulpinum]|uniref:Uncharacterized protein n=1 Tax=Penicillium vulpinum TaxID=29845 RepID=A0A1V6RZ10_9EURO|nr:uncharacterized protein N7479_009534 [Penicillium vulpinum]KAJ5951121.1 hypothetical protein N7479_009534 [Penicillium vulpinum]OQE06749.1 hypothetical protein PENVUL_c016G08390 [Penicillium vulpinum]